MKRLLFLLLIFSVLIMGCTAPKVTPEPEYPIIHGGGHYQVYFHEWAMCSCPSCPKFPEGTYWFNYNGLIFLIGEPVKKPIEVYGECPRDYIEVYF